MYKFFKYKKKNYKKKTPPRRNEEERFSICDVRHTFKDLKI